VQPRVNATSTPTRPGLVGGDVNPKYIDVLSDRVSGYQFSPQWYFLLAQASVK
jgi:hypothetical protein